MPFTVYVLGDPTGHVYVGQTGDLERRLGEHASAAAGWTSGVGRGPWELLQSEEFTTRAEAMKREKQLKSGRANQELRDRLAKQRGG